MASLSPKSQIRFSLLAFVACLRQGHKWFTSNSRRGYVTCVRCGLRRKGW